MKVFSNNPQGQYCYTDNIIEAIEDSVKLGADVINMSIGASAGYIDPEDITQIALKKAVEAGTVCVHSAGNDQVTTALNGWDQPRRLFQLKDNGILDTESVSSDIFSAASLENSNLSYGLLNYKSQDGEIDEKIKFAKNYYNCKESIFKEDEIVDWGEESDNNYENKDIEGKVVLIKIKSYIGGLYEEALKKKAKGIIFINSHAELPLNGAISSVSDIPIISIGKSDGLKLEEDISKKPNEKFILTDEKTSSPLPNKDAGDISQYSSWGPGPALEFKPDITAPGGDIYSLANDDDYQNMSGTSMSSPHLAGAEALVLESIKDRNIDISGRDKVLLAKKLAMNTAKPLIDKYDETGTIPYSPRRQGAGLLQIDDAVKNNVTITGDDDVAAMALKEVGKTKEFTLHLKNYGDKDVTYNLSKEKVYSETSDDKGYIHEIELNNSFVTFDKEKVTVKANSTAEVKATLNIDKDIDSERFVEGFIKFDSEDEEAPSLSVPFMGFYGDWCKENIIDSQYSIKPNDSKTALTGLGQVNENGRFYYYGLTAVNNEIKIDEDKVGFSPNGDGYMDDVCPKLYMLRTAKDLDVQVLDKDKNTLEDLDKEKNVRKDSLEDGNGTVLSNAKWDGTTYNSSSGSYEKVEDGQYYVRITTTLQYDESKTQTLDLPVKIDTKAPDIKIEGVNTIKDGDGQVHHILTWEAKDDGGSGVSNVSLVYINGEEYSINKNDINKVNDKYSAEINLDDKQMNKIEVATMDNAGNVSYAVKMIKGDNLKSVSLSGISDNMIISSKELVNGKLYIGGVAGDDIKEVLINGNAFQVKDNYFKAFAEVTEGENTINVVVKDKDGNEVSNKNYKVILDNKAPKVTISPDIGSESPYYTTEDESIDLNIRAEDENKIAFGKIVTTSQGVRALDFDEEGKSKVNVPLNEGLNNIYIVIYDKAGNKCEKNMTIIKGNSKESFKVSFDNLKAVNYLNKNDTSNDTLTVKGHVNNTNIKEFKINDENVKINKDLTFAHDVKLNQGDNTIRLYVVDSNGNVAANYAYKVYYDSIAPKIQLDIPAAKSDGIIYTNLDKFNLKGSITDNYMGYILNVNGDCILRVEALYSKDEKFMKRDFEKQIDLKEGLNNILIESMDEFENKLSNNLKVVLDKTAPNKPTIKVNNNGVENGPAKIAISSDEKQLEKIEYSFDGKNYFTYNGKISVEKSTDLYARVTDYAGNVSEVEKTNIVVDNVAPNITVTGVIDGQEYYDPVKPVIDVDDKEATVTASLNGKEYNGEEIDTEGSYVLEVYAVDKVGNKSEVVRKSFTVSQKDIISNDKNGKSIVKHNNIKAVNKDTLTYSVNNNYLEAILEDNTKNAAIVSPNVLVNIPKEILQLNEEEGNVHFNQNIYDASIDGLNSIGKIIELSLNSDSGKQIRNFGNNKVKVVIKLNEEDLKGLDTSNLAAYYYDEDEEEWKIIGGDFLNDEGKFVFETNHMTKFTIAEKESEKENPKKSDYNKVNSKDISSKKNSSDKNTKEVNTGDINSYGEIVMITILLFASAIVIVLTKRKKQSN